MAKNKQTNKKKTSKKNIDKKNLILMIAALVVIIAIALGAVVIKVKIEESKNDNINMDIEKKEQQKIEDSKISVVNINSTSRPYAVMINNAGPARALQSGLQDAYIVYEIIVEGGITRYMALFLDQSTERIGSIRSSRHYFLDYALENDAIYVHHGQSPQAAADFNALKVDRVVADNSKTGWRDKSLNVSSEHTLFTSISKIENGIGSKRTKRNNDLLLDYSEESIDMASISNSKVANEVKIVYSGSVKDEYKYDAETKTYKRSVNGKAHTDYVTKKQYTFKNIITYQVGNTTLNDGSSKGRQEIENIGSGKGYYISEGYAIPITWEKSSRTSQTIYKLEDGSELKVNDGNTFIQIQPKNKELTIN